MKAGKPSKADLEERKRRKAKARADDRFRKKMEAKIAQGSAKIISWDEAVLCHLEDGALPDDVLVTGPFPPEVISPAAQFLMDRASTPIEQFDFDEAMSAALLDLQASDVPLDRETVRTIANFLRRTPEQRRLDDDRALIDSIAMLKKHLCGRGMTAKEAEEAIAIKAHGWENRATLLRMIRKAKKRLRRGTA